MSVPERVRAILEEHGIPYEEMTHEPVRTSQQAANVRGVPLQTGVKALVCRSGADRYVLVLLPADRQADLDHIGQLEGREIELADPADVRSITGCVVGAVPPFGHDTPLATYVDRAVFANERVYFNAGERTRSIGMDAADLGRLLSDATEL